MKYVKPAIALVSLLVTLSIWGFIAVYRAGYEPNVLQTAIIAILLISGVYAFVVHMRRYRDEQQGFPPEDELSNRIKYKAGYYAFIASMYVWMLIFLFKAFIPDAETMLGGGILLSAFISIAIRNYMTRNYDENQN